MNKGILKEITPLAEGDFMYVADRHKTGFTFPIHCHDVFELNFLENAEGCLRIVGDSRETVGNYDLVLITNSDLEHVWEQHECKNDDIHEITIQFNIDFESECSLLHTTPYKSVCNMFRHARRGLSFPADAIMAIYPRLLRLPSIKEDFVAAQELMSIFHELSLYGNARELCSSVFANAEIRSDSKRVMKVKRYLEQNYKDNVRLDKLAALVSMTPTAFSRFFKLSTGKSISSYMIKLRLGHAARMLIDSTETVSEICYCCGFNTLSNFNRLFKKSKGCSPTEFRMKYKKKKNSKT